jgi:hypothetical protein
LNTLDTVAAVRRFAAFYVREFNEVMPHSALKGRTPDEVSFGAVSPPHVAPHHDTVDEFLSGRVLERSSVEGGNPKTAKLSRVTDYGEGMSRMS